MVRQGGRFGKQALPRSRGASGKPNQAYEAGTEGVTEGSIIKRMLVHLWPKDEPALKVGLAGSRSFLDVVQERAVARGSLTVPPPLSVLHAPLPPTCWLAFGALGTLRLPPRGCR